MSILWFWKLFENTYKGQNKTQYQNLHTSCLICKSTVCVLTVQHTVTHNKHKGSFCSQWHLSVCCWPLIGQFKTDLNITNYNKMLKITVESKSLRKEREKTNGKVRLIWIFHVFILMKWAWSSKIYRLFLTFC